MKVSELFESNREDASWWAIYKDGTIASGSFKTRKEAQEMVDESNAEGDDAKVYVAHGVEIGNRKIKKFAHPIGEAAIPAKNPKLGFRNKGEKVAIGKEGIPIGGSKEWLKTFGATETHIAQALRHVRASAVFKQLKALGLTDESTDRQNKIGSITLVGAMYEPLGEGATKTRVRRIKFTVQPNGKIDETAQNDFHRAPVTSPKPRIVPGDPVSSISKSMEASMEKLVKTMTARRDREAKDQAKLKKMVDTK